MKIWRLFYTLWQENKRRKKVFSLKCIQKSNVIKKRIWVLVHIWIYVFGFSWFNGLIIKFTLGHWHIRFWNLHIVLIKYVRMRVQIFNRQSHLQYQIRFLKNNHCTSFFSGSKTNYGIIKTNSFAVDFPDSDFSYLALFPSIARLNHSCEPNCNHYWSGSHFNVRAVKPIRR